MRLSSDQEAILDRVLRKMDDAIEDRRWTARYARGKLVLLTFMTVVLLMLMWIIGWTLLTDPTMHTWKGYLAAAMNVAGCVFWILLLQRGYQEFRTATSELKRMTQSRVRMLRWVDENYER